MGAGGEIKRLRELAGKSAAVAASLIGVDAERMRKWERNNVDPSDSDDINKVEEYFGMTLNRLKDLESFQFVKKEKPSDIDGFQEKYHEQLLNNFKLSQTIIDMAQDLKEMSKAVVKMQSQIDGLTEVEKLANANKKNIADLLSNQQKEYHLNEIFRSIVLDYATGNDEELRRQIEQNVNSNFSQKLMELNQRDNVAH